MSQGTLLAEEGERARGGDPAAPAVGRVHEKRPAARRHQARVANLLSLPYLVMLVAFGLAPAGYAIFLSFVDKQGRFAGLHNFVTAYDDFRYAATFAHIGEYSAAFIVPSLVLSIGLALLLQGRPSAVAASLRFVYYLPQALIGAAGVVVWLFMLTPAVSPVGLLMRHLGWHNLYQVVSPTNLPFVLAIIAIWTSSNGILLMFAALSSLPAEVLEAARIDGANGFQLAMRIKLPMLRKWIAYTVILNIAACTQLVVEPQLVSTATGGAVGMDWSPLQLAYEFAYNYDNFPVAAALSTQLLLIAAILAVVVVRRTKLFRVEI